MSKSIAAKKAVFTIAVVVIVALIAIASLTGEWLLTAIAVGLAFGFAMQQAGFCGSAILSSVVLLKDRKGVVGAGIAISTAMVGFAVMAALGLITPNPKPLQSACRPIVGGLVFGVGMVLAGGLRPAARCSRRARGGCPRCWRSSASASARTWSATGLIGPWRKSIIGVTREMSAGPGINDTLGLGLRPRSRPSSESSSWRRCSSLGGGNARAHSEASLFERIAVKGWSFAAAGIFIGVIGWLAYLSSAARGRNYPLGVTHGVKELFSLVVGNGQTEIRWWLGLEVMAIVAGSALSAWLRGGLKLRSADVETLARSRWLGGVLVGAGAVIGSGCFMGNMLSGWALLSIHSLIFGVCTIIANWVTTILYMRGI